APTRLAHRVNTIPLRRPARDVSCGRASDAFLHGPARHPHHRKQKLLQSRTGVRKERADGREERETAAAWISAFRSNGSDPLSVSRSGWTGRASEQHPQPESDNCPRSRRAASELHHLTCERRCKTAASP